MKKLRFLLAAVLLLGQIPFAAFAAPANAAGPVALSQELQAAVTGGACSSCHNDPHPPPPAEPPSRLGSPYWELTTSTQIARTEAPGNAVLHYNNYSGQSIHRTVTYTSRDIFSWQVGGGVPRGIITASLGASYENVKTESEQVTIPPRTSYKYYVGYTTTRSRNDFTRWQDWTDGSRQRVNSGSVPSSHITTRNGVQMNPL